MCKHVATRYRVTAMEEVLDRLQLAELRRSREGLQSTHPGRMRFP